MSARSRTVKRAKAQLRDTVNGKPEIEGGRKSQFVSKGSPAGKPLYSQSMTKTDDSRAKCEEFDTERWLIAHVKTRATIIANASITRPIGTRETAPYKSGYVECPHSFV